ncbi:GSCFA domain-containing protein [Phocaeicola sp.]
MNFRTQVELPEKEAEIRHSDRIMLFGSCFTENIGNMLLTNKFRCDVNPFGILYNPLSVVEALWQILSYQTYMEEDLFYAAGNWHSWMHHSSFSSASVASCLDSINRRLTQASTELPRLDWLIVTWGTAFAYRLKEKMTVVGNCHKQPDRLFSRQLLSVEDVVTEWDCLLVELRKLNPALKILFTVSPIRHAKDGMHGNQISKSTLLLAIDELCRRWSNCYYFPSYEIMMDELRDYRFYADDMLHPSPMAIAYIWECFNKTYFSKETNQIMNEWEEIRKGLNHKPFDAESETYRKFLTQIVLKIGQLKEKFPYFELQKELEQCQARLKI